MEEKKLMLTESKIKQDLNLNIGDKVRIEALSPSSSYKWIERWATVEKLYNHYVVVSIKNVKYAVQYWDIWHYRRMYDSKRVS